MRAFWELSSCRFFGGGAIGPLPWDKCIAYAERKKLDPDMIDVFERVMRELDEAYLEFQQDQMKRTDK